MLSFSQTVFKRTLKQVFCILFVTILATARLFGAGDIGVVNVDKLNFRPEPGMNRPPVMTLEKGEKIVVLEEKDGWIKGVCKGQVGYIRNMGDYVTILKKTDLIEAGAVESLKKESGSIGGKINQSEEKILELSDSEKTIINGLNDIDQVLNTVQKKASHLQSLASALDGEIEGTGALISELKDKMKNRKRAAHHRLVALYKLNQAGGMPLILSSAASMYDLLKRKMFFQRILDNDEKILTHYEKDAARLNELLEIQKGQKTEKESLMTQLNDQLRIATSEKDKRTSLLNHIRSQKSLELAVIESLRQAQKSLDEEIVLYNSRLSPQPDVKERLTKIPFAGLKGLLKMPVKGKIISFFGPFKNTKYNTVNFRSGIDIQTERGEPVRAVGSGKVLFADWFKGYGNMLIIDHGNHYYTVYANIEELFKAKGAMVETGDVIATAGDTGSFIGPKLYFEIRYRGEPLDPVRWIKRG